MTGLTNPLQEAIRLQGFEAIFSFPTTDGGFDPNLDDQAADGAPAEGDPIEGLYGEPVDAGLDVDRYAATFTVLVEDVPEGADLDAAVVMIGTIPYSVGTVRNRIWEGQVIGYLLGLTR